ncbi:hypothetical protein [Deinococcus multiflagellatus]|uniref:Uncharacterized protein n=1 Tax=Deinococcus multiflagellatus TaxID=1656887 RepID=A0ABW1ZEI8_9DEIO
MQTWAAAAVLALLVGCRAPQPEGQVRLERAPAPSTLQVDARPAPATRTAAWPTPPGAQGAAAAPAPQRAAGPVGGGT